MPAGMGYGQNADVIGIFTKENGKGIFSHDTTADIAADNGKSLGRGGYLTNILIDGIEKETLPAFMAVEGDCLKQFSFRLGQIDDFHSQRT